MAIVSAFAVSENNIKVRWEEPYVSEALNKMMSCFPRGIYRGFVVEPMTSPGSGIKIAMDTVRGDSFALHEDLANGYKTAVFFDTDFELAFSFTPGTDYYVWLDVSYSSSAMTLGYIRIGEVADLLSASNAIPFAKFNSPGATINAGDITQDREVPNTFLSPRPDAGLGNDYGFVNDNEYGRILTQDQKDAADAADAPSGSNPFAVVNNTSGKYMASPVRENFAGPVAFVQLTGWYWVGNGGVGSASQWFALYHEDSDKEYLGSDGYSVPILDIWDSAATGELDPSLDATDGFYENPIVRFDFSGTSDSNVTDFDVFCGQRITNENLTGGECLWKSARPQVHGDVWENLFRRFTTIKDGIQTLGGVNSFRVDPPYLLRSDGYNFVDFAGEAGAGSISDICTDGEYVYYVQNSTQVFCVDPDDGTKIWEITNPEPVVKICTDGRYLYTLHNGQDGPWIRDRADGAVLQKCQIGTVSAFVDMAANGQYVVVTCVSGTEQGLLCWDLSNTSFWIPLEWKFDHGGSTLLYVCLENLRAHVTSDSDYTVLGVRLSDGVNDGGNVVDFGSGTMGFTGVATDGVRIFAAFDRIELYSVGSGSYGSYCAFSRFGSNPGAGNASLTLWYFDSGSDADGLVVDEQSCYVKDTDDYWCLDPQDGSVRNYFEGGVSSLVMNDCDGLSLLCIRGTDRWCRLAVSKPVMVFQLVNSTDALRRPFHKLAVPFKIR